jgi:hypothetical protein
MTLFLSERKLGSMVLVKTGHVLYHAYYNYNFTLLFCILMPCAIFCGTYIKQFISAK